MSKLWLIIAGGLLSVLIIAMMVFGLNLLGFWGNHQAIASPLDSKISPEEMVARRAKEAARLNSYGWVDKDAGLVRIPISQAMVLIADSDLPVGEPTATPTPTVTPTPTAPPTPTGVSEVPSEETPTPEPSPTATPAPIVDLANVSFKNNVLPIFEQHCVKCHGGKETEEGLVLKSYADVMAGSWNGSVIEPGDVANSYLIEQITSGRMPRRRPSLTPIGIQIISAWVEQGAPDN